MSLVPRKAQRNPSVTLVASTNVGYWAPGTECPFAGKKVLRVLSFDPDRAKGKKTDHEEVDEATLSPPLWFSINQSGNVVVLGEDEVKQTKYNKTEQSYLRKNGNVVSYIERKLKDGSMETYGIPPMHPEVYQKLVGSKKGKKRPRADSGNQSASKKAKPVQPPADTEESTTTTSTTSTTTSTVSPGPELPDPISHTQDPCIVKISDWTGCHGLYSIADAIGAEGLQAMAEMFSDKTDLDPHQVFDSWYTKYWMQGLIKLKTLPFAKQCPLSIEPQRRMVAMECLKNGFLLVFHIYSHIVCDDRRPPFVQKALDTWKLYRTLPITEWALTGPGLKNAATWDKGMKIASTPPNNGKSYPEYGSATVLGMFLAFAFHVTLQDDPPTTL